MKKIIYLLLIVVMAACAENNSTPSELSELQARRDELRDQYNELGTEIKALEEQISALDTNRRKTLVTVVPAKKDTFRHYFEVYGNVDVKRNALLVAESPGNVEEILVRDGATVNKGQVLIRLDDALIRKNLAEVETNYELAESLFERQDRLWQQNIGSEVQYLEAKNRKESLESTMATLREQLDKTTIRAPFSGVVDEVMIKVGEMAGAGMPVVRLVDLSEFHIEAEIPETYSSSVKKGNDVEVVVSGDTLQAKVTTVGSYINPANRTFRVLIDVASAESGRFKPNQLTILRINDYSAADAVILPSVVIQQDSKGENFVFVAEEDGSGEKRAQKMVLQTGRTYNGQTEILSGLDGDENIIARGSRSVRDDQAIEVTQN